LSPEASGSFAPILDGDIVALSGVDARTAVLPGAPVVAVVSFALNLILHPLNAS
jgi:hypothetical protein